MKTPAEIIRDAKNRTAQPPTNGNLPFRPTTDPPPPELVVLSFEGMTAKPVRWLVPHRLPAGKLVLMAGKGGDGKSTATRHLTARITTGRPAFGLTYTASPVNVLILSAEDGPEDTILPHLLAEGADVSRVSLLEGVRFNGKIRAFGKNEMLTEPRTK